MISLQSERSYSKFTDAILTSSPSRSNAADFATRCLEVTCRAIGSGCYKRLRFKGKPVDGSQFVVSNALNQKAPLT